MYFMYLKYIFMYFIFQIHFCVKCFRQWKWQRGYG